VPSTELRGVGRPARRKGPTTLAPASLRAVALLLGLLSACGQNGITGSFNQLRGDPYPLDDQARDVLTEACPEVALISYAGSRIRYPRPVRVVAPFAQRLAQLEQTAINLAVGIYGRAPQTLMHAGAYLCRPVRAQSARWSEHALGNALDLVGFGFAPEPKLGPGETRQGPDIPRALRGRFEVRVAKNWQAEQDPAAQARPSTDRRTPEKRAADAEIRRLHAHFLHALALTLANERAFRGLIGPPDPSHLTHLHLDMAPWDYVRFGP
jgi:hypothetical protein